MDNKIKNEFLGMSFSTARSRLVKMLLFRELRRAGNDRCFKCGGIIDNIDHLSIEHKTPWLHVSPDLFWNLDNVTFSHLACNTTDRYKTGDSHPHRKRVVDRLSRGVAWCTGHMSELPLDSFSSNQYNTSGAQDLCKECRSKYRRSGRIAV